MQREACRCGSTSHKRMSNSKCVLNRRVFKDLLEFPYAVPTPSNLDYSKFSLRHTLLLNARKQSLKVHGGFGDKYRYLLEASKNILRDLQSAENVERQFFQRDIQISETRSLHAQRENNTDSTVYEGASDVIPIDNDVDSDDVIIFDPTHIETDTTPNDDVADVNNSIIVIDEDDEEEYPNNEEENTNNCSLCLCSILGSISFFSKCHHGFHTNCINRYKKSCDLKKQTPNCPLCRSKGTIHVLYI